MSFLPPEYIPYIQYSAPPIIGAFIGYLTNRVAIRMLFRPLKAWRIFGMRVPMTPGVIPSKRGQLADNMGEVVGDHLLTSKEIGKALTEEKFQQHLLGVISERVGGIMQRDLPGVTELIPEKFCTYTDLGIKTIRFQLKEQIHNYIQSDTVKTMVLSASHDRIEKFLDSEVGDILDADQREISYAFIESTLGKMFTSPELAEWLEKFICEKVHGVLEQDKAISDIAPQSLIDFLEATLKQQTPHIMTKLAGIFADPDVTDKVVAGTCKGVENFINSLGPMAPMVYGFIDLETVEQKIREYLAEKEEDITAWLASTELQEKVTAVLSERFNNFCNTSLANIIEVGDTADVDDFCKQLSRQLAKMLQGEEVKAALAAMIRDTTESHLQQGKMTVNTALTELFGGKGVLSGKRWIASEALALLRSAETMRTLDVMIDALVDSLLQKRIGKLSNLLPGDVRQDIYVSLQRITSSMLEQEVPGIVDSLNIRQIIVEKLNSLDLLRLEGLLLSIMEEQFKYINLFGALLGFLIGCCNLVLLSLQ